MDSIRETKKVLVGLLVQAGVFGLRDGNLERAFIEGSSNPLLKDLGIDSLAEMELCIALEETCGVSIVPRQLADIGTLEDLVQLLQPDN